jgi:CubicO group peptidase (beta-lactamase class C family)
MQHTVFGPLGMTHSAYTREARLEKYIVPATNEHGLSLTLPALPEPFAAFTPYTSARDYGRFLAALLKDERSLHQIVVSPESGDGFVMFTNNDLGMALARPVGEEVPGGSHQVFRFPLLRDGLDNLICDALDVCP